MLIINQQSINSSKLQLRLLQSPKWWKRTVQLRPQWGQAGNLESNLNNRKHRKLQKLQRTHLRKYLEFRMMSNLAPRNNKNQKNQLKNQQKRILLRLKNKKYNHRDKKLKRKNLSNIFSLMRMFFQWQRMRMKEDSTLNHQLVQMGVFYWSRVAKIRLFRQENKSK